MDSRAPQPLEKRPMKLPRLIGMLICFAAPLVLLALIVRDGVNVPFWDEWAIQGPFFMKESHTVKDYFMQANESRIPVPKLVFSAVATFAGWQPKHYMYLGWGLVCVILLMFWRFCYRPLFPRGRLDDSSVWALAVSAALFFTPAAFENWLWGIQWVIFVPLICALAALPVQLRARSFAVRYAVTVMLNTVAMLTFSNGLIIWAVSFPFWRELILLLAANARQKAKLVSKAKLLSWTAAYLLTAFLAIRAYFAGYKPVSDPPPGQYALQHPWDLVKYFFAWCGRPFDAGFSVRLAMGVVMFAAVFVLLAFVIKAARVQRGWRAVRLTRILYPTLVIIAYACLSGAMTAVGRVSHGLGQTIAFRYLYHSGTLSLGLLAALNIRRVVARKWDSQAGFVRLLFAGTMLFFGYFIVRGWNQGLKLSDSARLERSQSLMTLRLGEIVPKSPLIDKVCPWANPLVVVDALRERGIYRVPALGDWLRRAPADVQQESGGQITVKRNAQNGADGKPEFAITGWAVIPDRSVPADAVLVCTRAPDGKLAPWLLLVVGYKEKGAIAATGKKSLLRSGVREVVPWSSGDFPAIECFAVDEAGRRLFPLTK